MLEFANAGRVEDERLQRRRAASARRSRYSPARLPMGTLPQTRTLAMMRCDLLVLVPVLVIMR
jgi:hypothetical protein